MRRLNAELDDGMPVLVTSRTTAWRSTVECSDVLTGAEVLELLPLDFAEAKSYLERTARPLRGPSDRRTTVWTPVLDSLQEDARSPAARALLRILTNPLMVALARTVYGDVSRDPQELLDDPRFETTAGIEEHLLDAFVPAAFGDGDADSRWRTADAVRWLTWLARELERRGTKRLAWWELYLSVPRALRLAAPALLAQALTFVWPSPSCSPASAATSSSPTTSRRWQRTWSAT
ncbi:hypothetical protein [Streptomyces alboflavus]|nr:hypothetical protein [Streptomyces alboflavus]